MEDIVKGKGNGKGKGKKKEKGEEERARKSGRGRKWGWRRLKKRGRKMGKGKGKGRWNEDSLRKVRRTQGRTDARTHGHSGDFILCPMLYIALDRQKTETTIAYRDV